MSMKKSQHAYAAHLEKSSESSDKSSILFWILSAITLIFLLWAPFQRGLFNGNNFDFERPIYSSFVWASVVLILLSIYLYFHWRLKEKSDLAIILAWLLPITYFISTFVAASTNYAANSVYIQIIYVAFFSLAYYLTKEDLGLSILKYGFVSTSYFIVIFGMMNWLGNKEAAFALVKWFAANMEPNTSYLHAVMSDSNGPRLTSVFQYANSYAAFLIAILLVAIFLVITSSKWYSIGIHAFMVVPIIISFFVTLSRGALVILPIVLLLVLPFLKPRKQVTYLIHFVLSFGLSVVILNKLTTIGVTLFHEYKSDLSLSGWTSLLVISLIYAVLAVLVQKFASPWIEKLTARFEEKRFAFLAIPVIAVIVGGIGAVLLFTDTGVTKLLPENIRTRIENINFQQHSVLERGTFYKDATKLFEDYPVFGAGGGAWPALYEKYQNNPYISRQAHNFFLQYLTDVGIIGFAAFLIFLIFIYYIYIRNFIKQDEHTRNKRFIFFIVSISILVHSSLDFDLSYVYLGILLFLSFGIMISNDAMMLSNQWKEVLNTRKWAYPSVMLLLSLFLFFTSVRLLSADSQFNQSRAIAAGGNNNLNDILAPLDNALSQHPNHPDYTLQKAAILFQVYNQTKDDKYYTEATALLDQALQKEPHNYQLVERKIYSLIQKNQTAEALRFANGKLISFPWKVFLYEVLITLNTDMGHAAHESNNVQEQDNYWNQAFEIYNRFETRKKELALLPKEQGQGQDFSETGKMGLALGQIQFIRGKYDAAEAMFRIGIGGPLEDQTTKQNIRWYLASLQKQGKADQALFDKLVAQDPNERQEIQSLVNSKF
ncbi:O-antigen ligase [Paenibacillus tianmuensis]|uniref:O-antigen ligase n=1 Tax=Paenibacillus tianmuensis TaxID=624147 RepID=A0A1G4TVC1_9BACL|nr:O-antigen ligase family protein [Paenibacillus tianmuensis]SCW85362.1 O-antigen ligase [Paenibacillus tianmuensis]